MTCTPIVLEGGGTAIVCGRGAKARTCVTCEKKATRLCDAPQKLGAKKTCSAPLCDTCRTEYHLPGRREPLDVCPDCLVLEARWTTPPRLEVRKLVVVSVPPPWHLLLALGVCPVLSLPKSESLLWAEWVAIHVSGAGEDPQAHQLATRAGATVPEHPLAAARDAVVAVAQVEQPLWASPGRGRAISPWANGPSLLRVEDVLVLQPIPWRREATPLPWEPPTELRDEVARAFRTARVVRAHLQARQAEAARAPPPAEEAPSEAVPSLAVAAPEDPYEAAVRRNREAEARTRALALRYSAYERSPAAVGPAGHKDYRCPHCQQWFGWHPGCHPHQCPTEARP